MRAQKFPINLSHHNIFRNPMVSRDFDETWEPEREFLTEFRVFPTTPKHAFRFWPTRLKLISLLAEQRLRKSMF